MSLSTGKRCLQTKQYLSGSDVVTNKQLLGTMVSLDDLSLELQEEIVKIGCDLPVFKKEGLLLTIYFSCCDKQQIISLNVSVTNEKYLDYIIHEILNCFSTELAA